MENFFIQTSKIILRPFTISDAADYFELTNDKKIQRYINNCSHFLFFHETLRKVEEYSKCDFKTNFYMVIEDSSTRKLVGALLISQIRKNVFDVTMMTHKDHRQKGFMTEALNAFTNYLPINNKLVFFVFRNNYASLHTIKKIQGIKLDSSELKNDSDRQCFISFTYTKT